MQAVVRAELAPSGAAPVELFDKPSPNAQAKNWPLLICSVWPVMKRALGEHRYLMPPQRPRGAVEADLWRRHFGGRDAAGFGALARREAIHGDGIARGPRQLSWPAKAIVANHARELARETAREAFLRCPHVSLHFDLEPAGYGRKRQRIAVLLAGRDHLLEGG